MFEWSIGFTYSQLLVSGVCLSQVNKRDLVSTGRVFLTPIGVYMNVVPITDNLFGYNSWLDVNRIESTCVLFFYLFGCRCIPNTGISKNPNALILIIPTQDSL
jgi:hypothetical protein